MLTAKSLQRREEMNESTEIMLLEMDFEGDPPCQLLLNGDPCGRPASARIYSACDHCGDESRFFSCPGHVLYLLEGHGKCGGCRAPRGITSYT